MTCGVYRLLCESTGKFYIGSSDNIEKRVQRHYRELRKGSHHCCRLQKLFDKNPDIEFKVSIKVCSREKAYEQEQNHITKNFRNKKFLNIGLGVIGGDNITRNPRYKQIVENISKGVKGWMDTLTEEERKWLFGLSGERNGMYGKTHTRRARKLMSKSHKGNQNAKGLKWSDESRQRFSESLKGKRTGKNNSFFGKSHDAKTIKRISESKKGQKPINQKQIYVEGKIFPSASEASRKLGIPVPTLSYRSNSTAKKWSEFYYVT